MTGMPHFHFERREPEQPPAPGQGCYTATGWGAAALAILAFLLTVLLG